MPKGIIGLGMWCVDTTYKINTLPQRGKLEPILRASSVWEAGLQMYSRIYTPLDLNIL